MFSAWPVLGSGDGDLIRLQAVQFLLLTGAMIVISVERRIVVDRKEDTVSDPARGRLAELTAPTG
jgi:hypothetical protein